MISGVVLVVADCSQSSWAPSAQAWLPTLLAVSTMLTMVFVKAISALPDSLSLIYTHTTHLGYVCSLGLCFEEFNGVRPVVLRPNNRFLFKVELAILLSFYPLYVTFLVSSMISLTLYTGTGRSVDMLSAQQTHFYYFLFGFGRQKWILFTFCLNFNNFIELFL